MEKNGDNDHQRGCVVNVCACLNAGQSCSRGGDDGRSGGGGTSKCCKGIGTAAAKNQSATIVQ